MKGLYYHPDRIKHNGAPILIDSGEHDAVTLFVDLIETAVPEVLENLEKEVYDAYAAAEQWYVKQKELTPREGPSEWETVKASNAAYFPAYINLKEELNQWANKYHLNGEDDLYQTLALWSIESYYRHYNELSKKLREQEIKQQAGDCQMSEDDCRSMDQYPWPYEGLLSLSDTLYFEDEPDDIELSKSIGKQIYSSFFSKMFPFAFTPDMLISKQPHSIL